MFLSAVSVLVFARWSSEFPEGLMNNPVIEAPSNAILWQMGFNSAFKMLITVKNQE